MPLEAENETTIPGYIDPREDNSSVAGRSTGSSAASFHSAIGDVEDLPRSGHPSTTDSDVRSFNRMSCSDTERRLSANSITRSVSAVGRSSRNSSVGSHCSNESTRTRYDHRGSRGLHQNRKSRSHSRRRRPHAERSGSTENVFVRPSTPFYHANMPPPPQPDMNVRGRHPMPPFFNAPPRRNSWSDPFEFNVHNTDHGLGNPFSRQSGRGSRRFGVSNEYEQLCPNPVNGIWNCRAHKQPNVDRIDHYRGRRRNHTNSHHPLLADTSLVQSTSQNNYNSFTTVSCNHPNFSRRPPPPRPRSPSPPPSPPINPRADRNNTRSSYHRSASARNVGMDGSSGTNVYENSVTRRVSKSEIKFGFFDDYPSTSNGGHNGSCTQNTAPARPYSTSTENDEPNGAKGGAANVNRQFEIALASYTSTSSENGSTYGDQSTVRKAEKANGKKKPKARRQGDRRRLAREFDNEIQEELARAQEMAIPVNVNRDREENNPFNLNPEAKTFAPTLHDGNGNRFRMVSDKGICYFLPQGPQRPSNPDYMVSTVGDAPNDGMLREGVENLGTDNVDQRFQTLSLNEHQHVPPTAQTVPQPLTAPPQNSPAPYGEQFAPQISLVPTESYVQNVYANPLPTPPPVNHNVNFNIQRPVTHASNFDLPAYPRDSNAHQHIPVYPTTYVVNREQAMMPLNYSPVSMTSPVNITPPVQNFDHPVPPQQQMALPFQNHYPLVSFPTAPTPTPTPSPIHVPLTPMFFASPSPTTGINEPARTLVYISPDAQPAQFHQRQQEMQPSQPPPPPVFNFGAYMATQVNPPPNPYFHTEVQHPYDHLDETEKIKKDDNEVALSAMKKIIHFVRGAERSSKSPLSDSDLIDQLLYKCTRDKFLDESITITNHTSRQGVDENDQEWSSSNHYSDGREVSDEDVPSEESADHEEPNT